MTDGRQFSKRIEIPSSVSAWEEVNASSRVPKTPDWEVADVQQFKGMLPGYELTGLLGRGGMGAVYRAHQQALNRSVAIKILPAPPEADESQMAERFRNEATAMARMDHSSIVSVFDAGETADGQLYFVMELVEGTDLESMIRTSGKLAQDNALAIVRDICEALDYAHDHGVIHRDIKPANILISRTGEIKVADFGLAKVEETAGSLLLTRSNIAMGTPDYAAPEILNPGTVADQRADIYAVGVMLYRMLTGDMPRGMFKMPSQKSPELDKRFDDIICKAMEESREERYQSAHEISQALDEIRTETLEPTAFAATPTRKQRRIVSAALMLTMFVFGGLYIYSAFAKADGAAADSRLAGNVNQLLINYGNVAFRATISSCDDAFGPNFGARNALDGEVSEGNPASGTFDDRFHTIFYSFGDVNEGPYSETKNELLLDFHPAVSLRELVTYLSSDLGEGDEDSDRTVATVEFWVNTGNGPQLAGTVDTTDTDDIGGFDRISLVGNWTDVTQVVFCFMPVEVNPRFDVRVGEVLTLQAFP
ncbi:MAG: serine/threonine protein kinase [Verrucomicrobiales bacterium]